MIFSNNISLKKLNTFGIDVKCKLFYEINHKTNLKELIKSNQFKQNNYLILGGGSNILFTKDYDGLIIKNEIKGIDIIEEDEKTKKVKVGAGENWHQFVLWTIKNELSGVENLALIPGNVGASPIQNIGAYGVEVKDFIDKIWAINLKNGKEKIFTNSECKFKYRDSIFKNELKNQYIILYVSFKLSKLPMLNTKYNDINNELLSLSLEKSTENICNAVINIRKRKLPDPKEIGNCGSFFKNPVIEKVKFEHLQKLYPNIIGYKISNTQVKLAAGWLIDQCGWKGYRDKDAGVHKNQALVLVNYGEATGQEIINLAQEIQNSVKKKFDINIYPEVNIIG